MNLYGFARNSPLNFIEPFGQDYYLIRTPAFLGIPHQMLYGDDGQGGYYRLDFAPVISSIFREYRRLCGKGRIEYYHGLGQALKEAIDLFSKISGGK